MFALQGYPPESSRAKKTPAFITGEDVRANAADYSEHVLKMSLETFERILNTAFGPAIIDKFNAVREELHEGFSKPKEKTPDIKYKQFLFSGLSGLKPEEVAKISEYHDQISSDKEFMAQLRAIFHNDETAVKKHVGMLALMTYVVSQDPVVSAAFSDKQLFKEVWSSAYAAFSLYASGRFNEITSIQDKAKAKLGSEAAQALQFSSLMKDAGNLAAVYDKTLEKYGIKNAFASLQRSAGALYDVFSSQQFASLPSMLANATDKSQSPSGLAGWNIRLSDAANRDKKLGNDQDEEIGKKHGKKAGKSGDDGTEEG